jgi:AbiV family abortive infection protein
VSSAAYPFGRFEPPLDARQRWELAGASLTNAFALRDDAVVLAEAERYQRSAFLILAALEETMKAYLCLTRSPSDDVEWKRFWETFRDHRRKLALLKEVEEGSSEAHDAGNKTLRTLRERGLYVEVGEDGNPRTPMGLVEPGEMGPQTVEFLRAAIETRLRSERDRLRDSESTMKGEAGS